MNIIKEKVRIHKSIHALSLYAQFISFAFLYDDLVFLFFEIESCIDK